MGIKNWADIKRKTYYFDFGPEKGSVKVHLKSKLDAIESLKEKLYDLEKETNWEALKADLVPLKRK